MEMMGISVCVAGKRVSLIVTRTAADKRRETTLVLSKPDKSHSSRTQGDNGYR